MKLRKLRVMGQKSDPISDAILIEEFCGLYGGGVQLAALAAQRRAICRFLQKIMPEFTIGDRLHIELREKFATLQLRERAFEIAAGNVDNARQKGRRETASHHRRRNDHAARDGVKPANSSRQDGANGRRRLHSLELRR
ncbi:MAG: hypothetical protein U1E30_07285 [Rhodoblastus sp.]